MERTFYYKVGRFLQLKIVKIRKIFTVHKRVRLPKNLTEEQRLVVKRFLSVLKNQETKIYSPSKKDPEWVLYLEKQYSIVLSESYIRIINSVYGYDIPIAVKLEYYLIEKIYLELNKRKDCVKVDINRKVMKLLDKTY